MVISPCATFIAATPLPNLPIASPAFYAVSTSSPRRRRRHHAWHNWRQRNTRPVLAVSDDGHTHHDASVTHLRCAPRAALSAADRDAEQDAEHDAVPPSAPSVFSDSSARESEAHNGEVQIGEANGSEAQIGEANGSEAQIGEAQDGEAHDAEVLQDGESESLDPASQKDEVAPDASLLIPISMGPISFSVPARSLLFAVPFFWGSFAPAVRFLIAQKTHQDPSVFNSERLLLSTLVYVPVLWAEIQAYRTLKTSPPSADSQSPQQGERFAFFRAGVELGVYVFLANIAQVVGLKQTSASRAAFLVQLQTVFVPIFAAAIGAEKISLPVGISSLVAVAGVALLSSDKSHAMAHSFTGDVLEVTSALFFSAYVLRLGKFASSMPANPLVATKIAVQAVLSIAWAILVEATDFYTHTHPTPVAVAGVAPPSWTFGTVAAGVFVVLWTGLIGSAAAGWAQTKGQRSVAASEAVLIYATQPLWATALAAVALGESFGSRGIAGGGLIVVATLIPSLSKSLLPSLRDNLVMKMNGQNKGEKER